MVYIKNKTKVFPFKSLSSDFGFDSDKNLENSRRERKKKISLTHTQAHKTPTPYTRETNGRSIQSGSMLKQVTGTQITLCFPHSYLDEAVWNSV